MTHARRPDGHARAALACLALLGSLAVSGCGGGNGGNSTTAAQPARADSRPALPAGWRRQVNSYAGYNLGIPPSWLARGTRGATVVKSPDGVLVVSIAADRGDSGLHLSPLSYARETVANLHGYGGLRRGAAGAVVDTRYPTASATATGTLGHTGVRQAILVFAVRHPGDATYSLIFFRSTRVPAARYATTIERMVRSFRTQPPTFSG